MAVEVNMPRLGIMMDSDTITEWHVKEGLLYAIAECAGGSDSVYRKISERTDMKRRKTGKRQEFEPKDMVPLSLIIVHEAPVRGGIGGEIAAFIADRCFVDLKAPIKRLGGADAFCPFNAQEYYIFPDDKDIVKAVKEPIKY